MTWAQWLVGATIMLGLLWEEGHYRQTHYPYRRSRREQIEAIHREQRTRR